MVSRTATRPTRRPAAPPVYTCGDVEVDCGERVVRIAGQRQLLTYSEFEALVRLVESRGRALSREELRGFGRDSDETTLRAVDTLITRLRHKLCAAQLFRIETVQRIGYRCHWTTSPAMTLGTPDDRP